MNVLQDKDSTTRRIYMHLMSKFPATKLYADAILWVIESQMPTAATLDSMKVNAILSHFKEAIGYPSWLKAFAIFRAAFVLVISDCQQALHFKNTSELKTNYPDFSELLGEELYQLLKFRNNLVVALLLFDPNFRPNDFLDMIEKLSGCTSPSHLTPVKRARRELIFERETGVLISAEAATKAPTRIVGRSHNATGSNSSEMLPINSVSQQQQLTSFSKRSKSEADEAARNARAEVIKKRKLLSHTGDAGSTADVSVEHNNVYMTVDASNMHTVASNNASSSVVVTSVLKSVNVAPTAVASVKTIPTKSVPDSRKTIKIADTNSRSVLPKNVITDRAVRGTPICTPPVCDVYVNYGLPPPAPFPPPTLFTSLQSMHTILNAHLGLTYHGSRNIAFQPPYAYSNVHQLGAKHHIPSEKSVTTNMQQHQPFSDQGRGFASQQEEPYLMQTSNSSNKYN